MPGRVNHLSSKEKALSLFFVLLFSFALFQQKGRREDWPFSFFGMYQDTAPDFRIIRYDLDYIAPGKPPLSLYHKANGYYFYDKFMEIGHGRHVSNRNEVLNDGGDLELTPSVLDKMRVVLAKDALPIALKEGYNDPEARIRLRYRIWKEFRPEHLHHPLQDIVILEPTLAELEEWAK